MPSAEPTSHPVRLRRTEENVEEIDRLRRLGDVVGLAPVLDRLNRRGSRAEVPGRAVDWGFAWNDADATSARWWPQGVTTSADAGTADDDRVGGRRLLVTSWYSRQLRGENHGSRITLVDIDTLEYRHVLLVRPDETFGQVVLKPVLVHAGGLAWFGPYLHVAGTRRGLLSARLDDIVEVEPGPGSFGHRFVLPVRFGYDAEADADSAAAASAMRYSFLSLDRSTDPPELLAGEYGVGEQTRRLVRYSLDPATAHLRAGRDGWSEPTGLDERGLGHMQGAVTVDGTWFVTTSRGPRRRGHLQVGRPGEFRTVARALPPGPEDITYWPATDRLWSLSEHPGKRWVFCIDRPAVVPDAAG
jgi:hypothetical protein